MCRGFGRFAVLCASFAAGHAVPAGTAGPLRSDWSPRAPSAEVEKITIERVFGPEMPGRYKHPAAFTELANGDLYLVYYGGAGEYETDTAIYGSRRTPNSNEWSRPIAIADTPGRSDGNAVVWQAPDGIVWLFYVVRYGETWSDSRIKFKQSADGARTWTDSDLLTWERGTMVRARPIALTNGDYLLPVYHETGHDRERVAQDTTSFFLRYVREKKAWVETNRVRSRLGNLQPSVVQIDDRYLVAYCRRGGGYGGDPDGWLVRTESRDGGWTWSDGRDSAFPNPNAATDFIKLANGHLLLVFNDSHSDRMPLVAAVSTDRDQSYPHRRTLVDKPGDTAAYPMAVQTRDGKIHVVYTSDRRSVVNHAIFDESAIVASARSRQPKSP